MREIPINLKEHEVRAIIDGRQAQLRRIVKPQPTEIDRSLSVWRPRKNLEYYFLSKQKESLQSAFDPQYYSPYGWKSDRLWVRETWSIQDSAYGSETVYFKADNPAPSQTFEGMFHWKPSIHMEKWFCRLWLEVVDVRVERLQDITEEGAIAEGVEIHPLKGYHWKCYSKQYADEPLTYCDSAKESFKSLWESIHGTGSWDINPYLWVVQFKKISTPSQIEALNCI